MSKIIIPFTGQTIGYAKILDYVAGQENIIPSRRNYHAICEAPIVFKNLPNTICGKKFTPNHNYLQKIRGRNQLFSCGCQNPILVERRLTRPATRSLIVAKSR